MYYLVLLDKWKKNHQILDVLSLKNVTLASEKRPLQNKERFVGKG